MNGGPRPPWERRRLGRRPSYGYLSVEPRRQRPSIWFSLGIILPLLVIAGLVWQELTATDTRSGEELEGTVAPGLVVDSGTPAAASSTPVSSSEPARSQESSRGAVPGIELPTGAPPRALGVPPPEISAEAAIVLDGDSLAVLYERKAHERRQPASLTKIVTAIVAAEHANLEAVATSRVHHWDLADSTSMGLMPGDEFTIRDLLYGLMLVSGNDAAQVIAQHIAGSEEAYVVAMNLLIERLQLKNTQFRNVHGLSEEGQYSTAYDLALLARHLMANEELRTVVGTEETTVTGTREGAPAEIYMYNQNPLLNYTSGVDGVKTGFTEEAGRTFAASVLRDGHRIYLVLLNAPSRAEDAIALIEWAYEAHEWE